MINTFGSVSLYPRSGSRGISDDPPRHAHVLSKFLSYEEYCRRDRWQAHRRLIAVYHRCKYEMMNRMIRPNIRFGTFWIEHMAILLASLT
jgi:hypothetical protein